MFTSIVVGTDGSASAAVAVDRARELATRSGALLHLVTADVGDDAARRAEAEAALRAQAEQAEAAGVSARTHVEAGRASAAILAVAAREDADLLVVGGRGMQGPRRILGSVPNDVAHQADCSVLIADSVRDGDTRWPGPVVVGADHSATAAEAVRQAAEVARLLDQPLHIVTGYKPLEVGSMPAEFQGSVLPQSAADQLLDDLAFRVRQAGTKAEVHAVRGDGAAAILEVAEHVSAGVVAVGNRGMSGIARLLGSVAHKVVHHAPCDVFVVHTT